MGGPLLSTSVHVPDVLVLSPDTEVPDVGSILEAYGSKGLDFVVDVGRRVVVESSVSGGSGWGRGACGSREGQGCGWTWGGGWWWRAA